MTKKLSIIIPVYNECVYITRCLENVEQVEIPNWTKEIIIVNDGSTDNSLQLIKKFASKKNNIKIVSSQKRQGKGAALKKGITLATGDIIIIQDADLEYDPEDFKPILTQFQNKNIDVVYGSRILGAKIFRNYSASIFFLTGGIILTKLINLLFSTNLTDQPTCYKSWRNHLSKELLKYCRLPGFEFEVEMTAFFSKNGKIKEVPIRYYPRTINHGKKIRLTDFFRSAATAFGCKFNYN